MKLETMQALTMCAIIAVLGIGGIASESKQRKTDTPTATQLNAEGKRRHLGRCMRCEGTWNWRKPHPTTYWRSPEGLTAGCFPLCEDCWQSLTPQTRLPYYRKLYNSWSKEWHKSRTLLDPSWSDIEKAVMSEQ